MLGLLIGIVMVVVGGYMVIKVQKRNFERTNGAGVLEFDNFKQSYWFGVGNRFMNAVGYVLLVIGLFTTFISLAT